MLLSSLWKVFTRLRHVLFCACFSSVFHIFVGIFDLVQSADDVCVFDMVICLCQIAEFLLFSSVFVGVS